MALTTVPDVKSLLGITGTDEDARLAVMVAAASASVQSYCGRNFESTVYGTGTTSAYSSGGDSGYYSGDGSRDLILRQRPVTAVASVYQDSTGRFGDNPDGAFASSTLLVAGTDYVLMWDGQLPGASTRCSYSGILRRLTGVWPASWQYSAGSINPQFANNTGNIKITYTAGYSTVPSDIQYAVALVVAQMRRTAIFGGDALQSESYENYSYHLGQAKASAQQALQMSDVKSILGHYREIYI